MTALEAVKETADLVRKAGGRALLVGGCVRDTLLGELPKDFDLEVFGIAPDALVELLKTRFTLDLVGMSFGVIKLHHLEVDIAIPRRETKLGLGHRAFDMKYDPTLTLEEASARRDFTINAIYRDPLTDEILDPWNGRADLENHILRHVSEHFREDPLRVLRGMQFTARFGLEAAPETIAICRDMTPEGLPPERLFEEWSKLLIKGKKISKGLEFLRAVGWTRYYPELERLIGCKQAPEWHPEGDVWNHTLCCLDHFAAHRTGEASEDLIVGLAVLCHDFGKPKTSRFDPIKQRITSKGHDEAGVEPTLSFLRRLTNEERILREVPPLVQNHMVPFALWKNKSGDSAIRRLAAKVGRLDRLIRVSASDDGGRPPFPPSPEHLAWLAEQAERLSIADSAPKPLVLGRHLIERFGMKPGPKFGRILARAYEAQLDGKFFTVEDGLKFISAAQSSPSVFVLNGWAASPHAWDLCRFPKTRIFSYIEQLDGRADKAMEAEDSVILVGWSMGGTGALRLSVKFREKIRALILVAATPRMLEDKENEWVGMSERRLKAFETGVKLSHGEPLFGIPEGRPNPYMADTDENLQRGLDFLRDTDFRADLLAAPSANFPVSVFHSEHDGVVRPANAAFIKRVFPQASVTMVPGSEHALPVTIPELIDRAVLDALNKDIE